MIVSIRGGLVLAGLMVLLAAPLRGADADSLPRFTEEREAAALFFVKKHLPDLVPFLDQLKKKNVSQYQKEIREIFQVTEMLADLVDEPRRHDLELKIWKTENRAHILVAQMSTPEATERKDLENQLHEVARELVDLEIQVLKLKADQLEKELGEINDELARLKDNTDKETEERFKSLMEKVNKRRKP